MWYAADMLAILRIVFQLGLEAVEGGDAEEVHLAD